MRCKLCGKRRHLAPNNADVGRRAGASVAARQSAGRSRENSAADGSSGIRNITRPTKCLYAIYGSQQNWEKAETLLKLWVANNPKESSPVLRLAAFYYGRKQPDDAEKTLNSLLDRRDQFPQADLLVGDFHALIRNPEKALADYQRGESRDHEPASRFTRSGWRAHWPALGRRRRSDQGRGCHPGEGSQEPVRAAR